MSGNGRWHMRHALVRSDLANITFMEPPVSPSPIAKPDLAAFGGLGAYRAGPEARAGYPRNSGVPCRQSILAGRIAVTLQRRTAPSSKPISDTKSFTVVKGGRTY
jgi:hypothetical protein